VATDRIRSGSYTQMQVELAQLVATLVGARLGTSEPPTDPEVRAAFLNDAFRLAFDILDAVVEGTGGRQVEHEGE
jgi:hypothetical protein